MIKVGLFVNAEPAEICRTCDALGLDLIQLHGDEPPELLSALGGRPVMKAFRAAGADGIRAVFDYLETCRELGCLPRLILLDAPLARGFGGSGKLADWTLARQYLENRGIAALVLAGGLKAENVAEAIRATGAERSIRPAAWSCSPESRTRPPWRHLFAPLAEHGTEDKDRRINNCRIVAFRSAKVALLSRSERRHLLPHRS